jgi:ABC-2 type transport system permease protein
MYWSIRRELWENRSIYVAPLVVAAVFLLGVLISMVYLPERRSAVLLLDPARQQAAIERPYDIAAALLMVTAVIVGVFYCLDALHGERRDRTILFWKSLPVSDLTTVLSKASVPLVILPLITFAIIVATALIMLLLGTAVLLMNGLSAAPFPPLARMSLVLLYGIIVPTLWYAPIYGWLLLVSGWARRAPFLWAVLPPLVVCVVERIGFGTSYSYSLLKYRLSAGLAEGFTASAHSSVVSDWLSQVDPGKFLSSPGLWSGLVVAAAFLAAAVWLRRYREPI